MLLPLSALRGVPLGPRIALAALALCLPVSFVLSLITPVAIRALLPDVAHTGRVVGLVYALGTLGSLAGNFLTGFVLIAYLTTTTIVAGCAVAIGFGEKPKRVFRDPRPETRNPTADTRYPNTLARRRMCHRLHRQFLLDGAGDQCEPLARASGRRVAL
jgi:hypothetical protein